MIKNDAGGPLEFRSGGLFEMVTLKSKVKDGREGKKTLSNEEHSRPSEEKKPAGLWRTA